MQCCPVDIIVKKEWEDNLLSDLDIPLDEIDRIWSRHIMHRGGNTTGW